MTRFSAETEEVLRSVGWREGRKVSTAEWRDQFERRGITMHHAAERFLAEFGGISVDISGPGISSAREPFELEPSLAYGEEDRFSEWGEEVGASLFPIGELDQGRFFLAIDEKSVIYLVADWLAHFGEMPAALDNLVLGVAPEIVIE
ncbi:MULTISPECIES: SUKH-3 domain-containing protein [unclassified Streptomyces]|uniref:SUKH-3 domain-containing protein n=1 Tax=unclassified Streptomyces TaxID=2593676 RepID=UPI001661D306|nr:MULTISPECIES: SUKH-3 domain-containing protein [unclassified Streptomyces]MBD0838874.1 SUKH-3 domain-containing protein [Streptomyces sp. TRM68416]